MPYPYGDYRDIIIDLLCKLYRLYGEDCRDLGINWPGAIQTVLNLVEVNGPPATGSPEQEQALLAAMLNLAAFVNDGKCPASPAELAMLRQILDALNFPKP